MQRLSFFRKIRVTIVVFGLDPATAAMAEDLSSNLSGNAQAGQLSLTGSPKITSPKALNPVSFD
jgi:hypothetical protein